VYDSENLFLLWTPRQYICQYYNKMDDDEDDEGHNGADGDDSKIQATSRWTLFDEFSSRFLSVWGFVVFCCLRNSNARFVFVGLNYLTRGATDMWYSHAVWAGMTVPEVINSSLFTVLWISSLVQLLGRSWVHGRLFTPFNHHYFPRYDIFHWFINVAP
jgi:hypothetical protein